MKNSKLKKAIIQTEQYWDNFLSWLDRAEPIDLYRININKLADSLEINRKDLLEGFVLYVKAGIFDVNWNYHCPNCHGIASSHNHLSEATNEDYCNRCNINFKNILDENIKVTFTPSERYMTFNKKFIDEQMVTIRDEDFVSGLDCLHIKEFKDLLDFDVLPHNETLVIKSVCLLFSDIKGSTALYERVGDAIAYKLIRDHFEILFNITRKHNGVVIKTIGDAVMASFKSPVDGVKAAMEIREAFLDFNTNIENEKEILVKIGIHSGPTIMVTLNNRVDYFGQTVNLAARLQSQAKDNQIIISEKIRGDREVINIIKPKVKTLIQRTVSLKGIEGNSKIFILNY